MLNPLMPWLCKRSCFALALFLGFTNHNSHNWKCYVALSIVSIAIMCKGVDLVFVFPSNAIWIHWYRWLLSKYLQLTQYTIFFYFLEDLDLVSRPQARHPLCPLVTHLTNSPYAAKSCMFHIHIAFKLKHVPK
jgi:hypothetical protein